MGRDCCMIMKNFFFCVSVKKIIISFVSRANNYKHEPDFPNKYWQ